MFPAFICRKVRVAQPRIYACKCYLSAFLSPPSLSSWASAISFKVSAASAAATLAACAALAASARSSSKTLSISRREILAFRFSSRAFSVAETCWLCLFSHLAVVSSGSNTAADARRQMITRGCICTEVVYHSTLQGLLTLL